jgi:hypothetical protein
VTLEQLGNIGELVGGIAVIASLLYVAVQLKQNTKITKSSVRQSIASRASEFQLAVAQNDQILAVGTKLFQREKLLPQEQVRLHFVLGCLFRATEEAFLQHREGFLEADYWIKRGNLMLNYLRYPDMFEAWRDRLRSTYHPAFVEWIEGQFPRDAA